MERRSAGEWAGMIAAVLVAGSVVGFVVAVVGSFVGLPTPVLVAAVVVALAGFGYVAVRGWSSAEHVGEERVVEEQPLVGIVMGSKSDEAAMEECGKTLALFGVPYEVVVASAHRQPEKVREWAEGADGRGMRVIIAAAGKAAHLGGVVAAFTPLPVIAVPMKTSDLGGLDSLLSMVQMPSGVPVACVAINGARNAAILAVQILGTSSPEYRERIVAMKREMAEGR